MMPFDILRICTAPYRMLVGKLLCSTFSRESRLANYKNVSLRMFTVESETSNAAQVNRMTKRKKLP